MKAVEFPGVNVTFAKDQPEYTPLPALRVPSPLGEVITCWELSDEELEQVKKTKRVYLSQLTFNNALQPIRMMTDLADGVVFTK
jgi:hypothetical protein